MADYLLRENAPLTEQEWAKVDELVTSVASRLLVGRRVLPLFGPLGAGVQTVPVDTFDLASEEGIRRSGRVFVVPRMIAREFILGWQDIETGRSGVLPLELSPAAAAASACALAEDTLIFRGDAESDGILNAEGCLGTKMSDWATEGAFNDILAAVQKLQENGITEKPALVVSPAGYALMQKPFGNTGALELAFVRELMPAGVFQTPVLKSSEAVVIATGPQNADLAVGVDLSVGYVDQVDMDHRFRVLETLALRVKRPQAICTITR
ncbi:MAG TPA: family 1 encapsulin nanocompartment shell protein [Candidatus Latescibacteria bacterium]|jgi:uncharacterized linocin/CFP29 family protein|nr:family 1 encapsulin nanocompartment shell protein [Candidatus Latescibacterota bacterium]HQE62150.1 family 1 encapsulin nanocompartment shell protein [Candidatus Latescibacterota bacterium]HQI76753.1 family 1 encapsulin nanocompartment shell protein [Candidatus Latescibacterota bacterium]HQK22004.1 family 1 encapsulin nanocompartment shell protein [Candidatus Latescibacterota bacterium]